MWDINNEMSNYSADSLLSKINQQAHRMPVKISGRLFGLIAKSLYYSRLSSGAFDITVGTIGQHYDFRKKIKPSDNVISDKLKYVSYKNIKLDNKKKTIFISNKYAQLDLGGIAKGYAIAQAIKILKNYKIGSAYISAGGDSYAIGKKNNRPWYVAIKNPRKGDNNIILPVSNTAISTSGDYERYFEKDNVRYHHIINPVTGHSAKKSVSVTVIGESPVDTDALSTTLFVLGEKKGIELIDTIEGYEAVYVYPDGKMTFSKGLKRELN
jgi:thiamine biosynthesis lipoprotein